MNALALSKFYTDIIYSINPRLVGTTCILVWCKYIQWGLFSIWFSDIRFWICDFRFLHLHKSDANCLIHQQFVQTNPGFGME